MTDQNDAGGHTLAPGSHASGIALGLQRGPAADSHVHQYHHARRLRTILQHRRREKKQCTKGVNEFDREKIQTFPHCGHVSGKDFGAINTRSLISPWRRLSRKEVSVTKQSLLPCSRVTPHQCLLYGITNVSRTRSLLTAKVCTKGSCVVRFVAYFGASCVT